MSGEVVHDHKLSCPQARREHLLDVEASKTTAVVFPSTAREGPMLSIMLMLASSVVFLPRLRGTEQYARSPRRDHARTTEREV